MSSKDKNENEIEKENENRKTSILSNDDNENLNENENGKTLIKELDEIIDKSKSFEDQVKPQKKGENIIEHFHYEDYGDKELKFKYFKIELAHLPNIIDKKLFEQIFDYKIETVGIYLLNTKSKEKNQIIVNNIGKNKKTL